MNRMTDSLLTPDYQSMHNTNNSYYLYLYSTFDTENGAHTEIEANYQHAHSLLYSKTLKWKALQIK